MDNIIISMRMTLPMHGPHALAKTVPPNSLSVCAIPSRSMVARICSDPGVTWKGIFDYEVKINQSHALSHKMQSAKNDRQIRVDWFSQTGTITTSSAS